MFNSPSDPWTLFRSERRFRPSFFPLLSLFFFFFCFLFLFLCLFESLQEALPSKPLVFLCCKISFSAIFTLCGFEIRFIKARFFFGPVI